MTEQFSGLLAPVLPWVVPFGMAVAGLGLLVGTHLIARADRARGRTLCLAAVVGLLIAAASRVILPALGVPEHPTPTPALWLGLAGVVLSAAAAVVAIHHTLRSERRADRPAR